MLQLYSVQAFEFLTEIHKMNDQNTSNQQNYQQNSMFIKIVHETATHQMTIEFKLALVPLWPLTMNQSPYHKGSVERPRNTNCETIHKTRQST